MTVVDYYNSAVSGIVKFVNERHHLQPGRDYVFLRASDEPRVVNVLINTYPGHHKKFNTPTALEELSVAAQLDPKFSIRARRGPQGTLALEIPKPEELWTYLSLDRLPTKHTGVKVTIGLDTNREPAIIDLAGDLTHHGLVAGTSGAGKTNTFQVVAWSVIMHNAPEQVQVIVIDTEKKGRKWGDFNGVAHLAHPVITDNHEAERIIQWLLLELDRRQTNHVSQPRIVLFIEELESLINSEDLDKKKMSAALDRLTRLGRESGINIWAATQNPTKEVLGGTTFRNMMNVRLVGRVGNDTAAHVATGLHKTGAERLTGKGDNLLVHPDYGDVRRLTVPLLTPQHKDQMPRLGGGTRLLALPGVDTDTDRVLAATDSYAAQQPIPTSMDHLAYQLAFQRGIVHLRNKFGIGEKRAMRLQDDAKRVIRILDAMGYKIVKGETA